MLQQQRQKKLCNGAYLVLTRIQVKLDQRYNNMEFLWLITQALNVTTEAKLQNIMWHLIANSLPVHDTK